MRTNREAVLCHLSFDDSWMAFNDRPCRFFDSDYFRRMESLHRKYGSRFTLFLLHPDALDGLSEDVIIGLKENSSWLRFSYHGNDEDLNSGRFLENFIGCTSGIASALGKDSLSDKLRVHRFNVDRETASALSEQGIGTLLAPDDDRPCISLDSEESTLLSEKGEVVSGGMEYWKTDIRLERENWAGKYGYWKLSGRRHLVVFSHEQLVFSDDVRREEIFGRLGSILADLHSCFDVKYL